MNSNASAITFSRQDQIMQMMPVWVCFASMALIWNPDILISNIASDLQLSSLQAYLLYVPGILSLLFLTFPSIMLVQKKGHKTALMCSLLLLAVALFIPASDLYYDYSMIMVSFSMMAVAFTLMLASIYIETTDFLSEESIASTLSFIQALVPLAAIAVPLIINGALNVIIPTFGLGWRIIFVMFAILTLLAFSALSATPQRYSGQTHINPDIYKEARLLAVSRYTRNNMIAVVCIVAINLISLLLISSVIPFLLCQAAGLFIGAFLLKSRSLLKTGRIAALILPVAILMLWIEGDELVSYISFLLIGMGNAILLSAVLSRIFVSQLDNEKNVIIGLMMTSMAGGLLLFIIATSVMTASGLPGNEITLSVASAFMIYYVFYGMRIKPHSEQ